MRLDSEFYKLPLRFDAKRLREEIEQFTEDDWRPHPQGFAGNSALLLCSVNGSLKDDGLRGPNRPTPLLERCPYLQQVLASFGTVIGRTRLMRLEGHAEAKAHMDADYYWHQRVRIHVPIITDPAISFHCGDKSLHMGTGECWLFNTWLMHNVINPTDNTRIHLVCDTVGSATFWDLADQAEQPFGKKRKQQATPRLVAYKPKEKASFETETVNFPVVMSPWEQRVMLDWLFQDIDAAEDWPPQAAGRIKTLMDRFHRTWQGLWARYGESEAGWPAYQNAIEEIRAQLAPFQQRKLGLPNGMEVVGMLSQGVLRPALNPALAGTAHGQEFAEEIETSQKRQQQRPGPGKAPTGPAQQSQFRLQRPVIIVAAPRSGSSFLFETLSRAPGLYTIGGESHGIFEGPDKLKPATRGFKSNRLTAKDADWKTTQQIHTAFLSKLRDRNDKPPPKKSFVRMLEKTPKNALRIPFLNEVFPNAFFVYLYREPQENISSIMEAWKSGRFVTYPQLPGWKGGPWSMLLIPRWEELKGKSPATIAAKQWAVANKTILDDLKNIPTERWCALSYADLVADPQGQIERLCSLSGLAWDADLKNEYLPLSGHTVTPPDPDKWKENEAAIKRALPGVKSVAQRAGKSVALSLKEQQPTEKPPQRPVTAEDRARDPEKSPLRSAHTKNIPAMLKKLGISVIVTTYQAGKLIIAREDEGKLNTHFRVFPKPMGCAVNKARLALGTRNSVHLFHNLPSAAKQLEPKDKHDACYLPRLSHVTGNIDIHEMAWTDSGLWIVNTKFGCLCTLDLANNFVPRWQPPFLSKLVGEDRCHLNGLGVVDGKPRYVTALGESDEPAGWRENKATGGILMDITSNEFIARGLSMPHSPRWYDGKLWVLESGDGNLSTVDLDTGQLEVVAKVPGFTRGLSFYGPLAFIGLSQIRETATFGSLPLTERLTERICGVWVVNIKTGQIVGFMKFLGAVQEIFAVEVLEGIRFPDILQSNDKLVDTSFVLPREALAAAPKSGSAS